MKYSIFGGVAVVLISTVFMLPSCKKDKVPVTNLPNCVDTVSFNADILPLMQNNCVGCHDAGNASAGYDFSSYDMISSNASAALTSMRASGSLLMPQGGPALPDSVIQKLECWIAQGKLPN
ncbi:MAG: hypothetical protein RLZZ301_1793 [Bacteroidota bacterium]|jgi:hypothetical protein